MSIADKLVTVAENQQRVYDAGYAKGQNEADTEGAYNEGYEAGQQAEYDRFWDTYQRGGNRQDYQYAFYGTGWTDDAYKPKYIPKPTKANSMYRYSLISKIEVDFTNLELSPSAFGDCPNLQSISIKSSKDTVWGTSLFQFASSNKKLKELIVEGVIGKNASVSSCNYLNHDSLMSVINALYDYSNDTGTHTLTMGTTNLAKLTDAEKAIATEKGWTLV